MTTHGITALWSRATSPVRFLRAIGRQIGLARSRRALKHLDDHLLRDIGLTRYEAETEVSRPSWDVTPHWRG